MTHKPFRDLTDAEKGALLLADWEGKTIEHYVFPHSRTTMREWREWRGFDARFYPDVAYRIAPEAKTHDAIDWSHVSDEVVAVARDDNRPFGYFYTTIPVTTNEPECFRWHGDQVGTTLCFASYRRGTVDWQDSLIIRPGYEGK